jgi:hypothetical protein
MRNEVEDQRKREEQAAAEVARLKLLGKRIVEQNGLIVVRDPVKPDYDPTGPYL